MRAVGWNTRVNGVKRQAGQMTTSDAGFFGVINLLAPRPVGDAWHWDADLTFVQLRFAFVASTSELAVRVPHTFLTFYDFDTGAVGGAPRISVHACPLIAFSHLISPWILFIGRRRRVPHV